LVASDGAVFFIRVQWKETHWNASLIGLWSGEKPPSRNKWAVGKCVCSQAIIAPSEIPGQNWPEARRTYENIPFKVNALEMARLVQILKGYL
jgi:hypothetical protein